MSEQQKIQFKFPNKVEKLLAALSEYYQNNDKPILQRIVVNSTCEIEEGTEFDNWDGGMYGHTLRFHVPLSFHGQIFQELNDIQRELSEDLNRMFQTSDKYDEYIADVLFEPREGQWLHEWRQESGALMPSGHESSTLTEEQQNRIWTPGYFRLFMTHKATCKREAGQLKPLF